MRRGGENEAFMILVVQKAAASAFRGGSAGAIAMVLQVVLLMWLRTVINFQYRNGGTTAHAFRTLYAEGGVLRFYQGAQYALLQGPLSRFGDTAANEGIKELLSGTGLSVGIITACASFAAALWRIVLTPVDTLKTVLQVSGQTGMTLLWDKVDKHGIWVLYDGALGNWGANMVGHYPWFVVNNQLEAIIPQATSSRTKLVRRAFIGFCSSVVSDCLSNGVRVVKTFKQTSDIPLSYMEAVHKLLESSGVTGLLFRGLGIKLISNALSSILFSVLWKMIMEYFQKKQEQNEAQQNKANVELADVLEEYKPLMPTFDPTLDSDSTDSTMEKFRPESPTITTARRRLFCDVAGTNEQT